MIVNTGSRTDIPAFYSEWFFRRIREGYVCVRNPYHPHHVLCYSLNPQAVDVLIFCSKNPSPMLERLHEIRSFRQYWNVTVTPYGRDIERNVPPAKDVVETFKNLSDKIGREKIAWRYDPIILTEHYDLHFHIRAFTWLCRQLRGYTSLAVVSFLDLYPKTRRNFPEGQAIPLARQEEIIAEFAAIARANGMMISLCAEDKRLERENVTSAGCLRKEVLEQAIHIHLVVPKRSLARAACCCPLGNDIGAYNSCLHGFRYCYANDNWREVVKNSGRHDENSPFLLGNHEAGDCITDVSAQSWISRRLSLF